MQIYDDDDDDMWVSPTLYLPFQTILVGGGRWSVGNTLILKPASFAELGKKTWA